MPKLHEIANYLKSGNDTLESIYNLTMRHGDAPSAQYDREGEIRSITFSEYDRRVRHAAASIQKILGVPETPTYIGIRLDNSPDYYTVFWGVIMAGYQPVLIDFRADAKLSAHIVNETKAVAVITEELISLPKGVHFLEHEMLLKTNEYAVHGGFANRIALCTSGTTGSAKVFVYDGQALIRALSDILNFTRVSPGFLSEKSARALVLLPFHQAFACITMIFAFAAFGKTLVYPKDRTTKAVQDACKMHHVTHLFHTPLFFNELAQRLVRISRKKGEEKERKLFKQVDKSINLQRFLPRGGRKYYANLAHSTRRNLLGTHISCCVTNGARILPKTLRILNGIGYGLVNSFAMTEVGLTSMQVLTHIDDQLSGCAGRSFQSVKYKVKMQEGDRGHTGELLIKSASMHIGRMTDGVLVPPELDEERYFSTGDVARLEGGKLWPEGRLQDVITIENGEKVFPDELECAFAEVEEVEQLCAFGLINKDKKEDIALVAYANRIRIDRNKLERIILALAKINEKLPMKKRINRCYFSVSPLPLTGDHKVKRAEIQESMRSGRMEVVEVDLEKRRISGVFRPNAGDGQEKDEEYYKILDKAKKVIADELNLDIKEIKDRAHFLYDLGGEGIALSSVFSKLEEEFSVLITDREYGNCTCAEDAALLLREKMKAGAKRKRSRIKAFEETREWEALSKRLLQAVDFGNPYFVPHDSPLRDTSIVHGREVINYGSYNYVCLSGHPRTIEAAKQAADQYGTSASGSRLLAGEKTLHKELERAIAEFKHTEDALVLVGGHSTNVTFVGNFCSTRDLILYDSLSHNSIVQGTKLSRAHTKPFPHNDYVALESILQANRDNYEKVLIVVEGVYSMDGDIAPIPEFVRIKKEYDCFLMVDEAHSSCTIGENGGGVDEYFHLAPDDIDIKMGTLSKGLGTCGGYLAGSKNLVEFMRYDMPGFVFSVGLSPVLAAATLEGIRILQEDNSLVRSLQQNVKDFVEIAHKYGFDTCLAGESPIVPVLIGADEAAFILSNMMLEEGVFVPPAVFPAVPKGQARLRFCLTSAHKREQAEQAFALMDKLIKTHGFQVPRKWEKEEELPEVVG